MTGKIAGYKDTYIAPLNIVHIVVEIILSQQQLQPQ